MHPGEAGASIVNLLNFILRTLRGHQAQRKGLQGLNLQPSSYREMCRTQRCVAGLSCYSIKRLDVADQEEITPLLYRGVSPSNWINLSTI